MTAQLDAALAAASRGWHVFPVASGGKWPALHGQDDCPGSGACADVHAGWEQRATTDPDRIRRCWQQAPFNVGVATGPSNLVVVDLDVPKPGESPPREWRLPGVVDGHDVFASVCADAGEPLPLDTYTVGTRSGGTHLYYQHPASGAELRNTTGQLGWLIDTRSHGGYVLAAGSTVGRRYTLVRGIDPAPLPSWLVESLTPAPIPARRTSTIELPDNRRGRYLTAAITQQLATIANAGKGGRNTALYRSAVALGQLVGGGALDDEEVTDLLVRAGLDAGLRPREVNRTVTSGMGDGARRPRGIAA